MTRAPPPPPPSPLPNPTAQALRIPAARHGLLYSAVMADDLEALEITPANDGAAAATEQGGRGAGAHVPIHTTRKPVRPDAVNGRREGKPEPERAWPPPLVPLR